MPEEKTFVFKEKLVDEILSYLGGRPYTEVAGIINRIAVTVSQPKGEVVPFPVVKEGEKE